RGGGGEGRPGGSAWRRASGWTGPSAASRSRPASPSRKRSAGFRRPLWTAASRCAWWPRRSWPAPCPTPRRKPPRRRRKPPWRTAARPPRPPRSDRPGPQRHPATGWNADRPPGVPEAPAAFPAAVAVVSPGLGGVPVEELDDDAVRVADLERALAPLLGPQRHRDRDALGLQPGQLALQVVHDEGEDQPAGVVIPLVAGQHCHA